MDEKKEKYLRDGRSPIPANESTSRVMSANKAKNTKPELALRHYLWKLGLKGYRIHPKHIPGRPDIVYSRRKLAIFVHGCFWHRCPICKNPLPKSNTEFWRTKFDKNVERDKRKERLLEDNGWRVLILWECQIKKNVANIVEAISKIVSQQNEHTAQ